MFDKITHFSGSFNKKSIKSRKRKLYACSLKSKGEQMQRYTEEYDRWRKQIFARDKNTCQCCGRKSQRLNAHHLYSFAKYPGFRTRIDNGVTLCSSCHYLFHKKYGKDDFPDAGVIGFLKYRDKLLGIKNK